ncbi:MAG: hypothetical protein KAV82_12175 [Phycisphaerae bacterium]|nr:hypothetical protein [Phycisphaerae bacterium]
MAHHHHHHQSDSHRDPREVDASLDAANQSLADALRASFNVLKFIMLVLVVLFLFSGVQFIDDREEAVVLQFGRMWSGTRKPGPSLALPYPVHETLRVPVRQDNVIVIEDHFIFRTDAEKGKPLGNLRRFTLDPVKDGALMTSDNGLVHVQWRLVYRIDNLIDFVSTVADGGTADAESLITAILDNAAIHAATNYTAEEITRHKSNDLADDVRRRVNNRLEELGTGIRVEALDIPESSVPIPTLRAFAMVSSAENQKQKMIREAQQERSDILNACAGEGHPLILAALDAWDLAKASGDEAVVEQKRVELDRLIETVAGGEARAEVLDAESYFTTAVQGIKGDEAEYNNFMDEYLRAPDLLFTRLWAETKQKIYRREGVKKWHLPPGQKEVRIIIGEDPQQRLIDEMKQIERKTGWAGRK